MKVKRRKLGLSKRKDKKLYARLIQQGYEIAWQNGNIVEVCLMGKG